MDVIFTVKQGIFQTFGEIVIIKMLMEKTITAIGEVLKKVDSGEIKTEKLLIEDGRN